MQKRIGRTTYCSAVFVIASACADDITGPNPPGSQPVPVVGSAQYQISAAVRGRTERGVEDEILRLESGIPGLGGLFIDQSGDVVVFAPAKMDSKAVRLALASRASGVRLSDDVREALTTGVGLKIRSADYSFSQLVAWRLALVQHLTGIRDVISTDASEATNRVRVTVETADANPAVLRAASDAQVPVGAIEITVGLRPIALATLRDFWRPTGGGLEIGFGPYSCSLGYNVTMNGLTGFLTASHCSTSAHGSGAVGESVSQPLFGSTVGTVHTNPAFNYSHPDCGGYLCTRADAMFVLYGNPSDGPTRVARPVGPPGINNNRGSITVEGWWESINQTEGQLVVGGVVNKVGRSTGWTRGTIVATCVSPPIEYQYVVVCASQVNDASVGEGDSGAPVFSSANRIGIQHIRQGILYAGTGDWAQDPTGFLYCVSRCTFFYSRWDQINQHLGAQISYGP